MPRTSTHASSPPTSIHHIHSTRPTISAPPAESVQSSDGPAPGRTVYRSAADAERGRRTQELLIEAAATDGDERTGLLQQVVLLNRSIADALARRYADRGADPDDLNQIAYLALVMAANRFDPHRGFDFLAFAVPTIRGEIQRHFRDSAWAIRPTRQLQELHTELISLQPAMTQELGRVPTTAELAERLEVAPDKLNEVRAVDNAGFYSPLSLDAAVQETGERRTAKRRLTDYIGAEDSGMDRVEARSMVVPAIAGLDERQRLVLRLRFYDELSQKRIGERIGVSQMQVSRILQSIFADLRKSLAAA